MSQYKYDDEGGQFLTFLLTFCLLVLTPLTWSLISGSTTKVKSQGWFDTKGQKVSDIKRLNRRSLLNPKISKRAIVVVAGWIAVVVIARKVSLSAENSQHKIYDPFSILGLATSATEKEIKKHYKRLSVKFHPDKLQVSGNQTKESIESYYIELTKAYKSLTDETIRKNFELYGHPDGRQEMSMGIALPTWVVESQNNIWVLGAYGIVFGVLMPYFVARWWYGSRSFTKDGLIIGTAQTYFQHLREDTTAPRILALLAISEEFEDQKLDKHGLAPKEEIALKALEDEVRLKLKEYDSKWEMIPKVSPPTLSRGISSGHMLTRASASPAPSSVRTQPVRRLSCSMLISFVWTAQMQSSIATAISLLVKPRSCSTACCRSR